MPRHGTENLIENTEELYEEILEGRGLTKITHYRTPRWPKLTAKVRSRFVRQRHTWKLGDKYYKLANQYYGDPKLWWVIAWYNEKPTEGHVKSGDTIYIPTPIEEVISFFNIGAR
tara:strand:- start:1014 stop:1358 length:345 start_codon:yes stop_codon:yes gene_type:complete